MKKRTLQDAGNACSLTIIQASNALFPIFAFPYLLSKFGADTFASFIIAETIALYVLIVCIYSFDINGINLIVEAENKSKEYKYIVFINIFIARLFLYFFSILLLLPPLYLYKKEDFLIFLIWLFFPLGMILQSNFYFQSIEKNRPLAFFVFVSRIIATVCIYLFVHDDTHILVATSILAGSFVSSGILAFLFLLKGVGIRIFTFIKYRLVFKMIYDGRHLFVGNASVSLFRGANVLILAGVSSASSVAAYSIAEKMTKSLQALARPLNQLFIPKVMQTWAILDDSNKTSLMALKIVWVNTRIQVLMMAFVIPTAISLIWFLSKIDFLIKFDHETIFILMILAPAVIFGVANAMFGAVGLTLIYAQSYFATAVFIVGLTMFLFSFVMSYFFNASGAAISFVAGEFLLLIAFIWKYKRNLTRG